jgi:hypothetical protein
LILFKYYLINNHIMIYNTLIPLIRILYRKRLNISNIDIEKGNNYMYSVLKSVVIYNDELTEIIIQQ